MVVLKMALWFGLAIKTTEITWFFLVLDLHSLIYWGFLVSEVLNCEIFDVLIISDDINIIQN